jgi:ATP-dependent NAD(P)H-hydrate dehydratase
MESDINDSVNSVTKWLPNIHSLVIGPGLGRDEPTMETAKSIISEAKKLQLPLVLDGVKQLHSASEKKKKNDFPSFQDGLFLLSREPSIISGYTRAILTPNLNEYRRLCDAVKLDSNLDEETELKVLCER